MTDDTLPPEAPPMNVVEAAFKQNPVGSHYELANEFADSVDGQFVPSPGRTWRKYENGIWFACDGDVIKSRLWGWLEARCAAKGGATERLVNGVFAALCVLDGFWRPDSDFDADSDFMCFANGVVQLSTGQLHEHSPRFLATYGKPFAYDPGATCPGWQRFIAQMFAPDGATPWDPWAADWVPDAGLVDIVQEWAGYVLSPYRGAQKALTLLGNGQTGKGIYVKVLTALVGSQFVASVDLARLDEEYVIGGLIGKRLAVATEFPSGRMIADAQFKALVGGDVMQGRLPYSRPVDFVPAAALTITCNRMPATADTSYGFYRRFLLVPTLHRIPEDVVVRDFDRTFEPELPGIFNWAWAGFERLRGNRFAFTDADATRRELAEYRLESDSVAEWAAQHLTEDTNNSEVVGNLFESYTRHCRDNGRTPVCSAQMTKRLREVFPDCRPGDRKKLDGTVRRAVKGVRLDIGGER